MNWEDLHTLGMAFAYMYHLAPQQVGMEDKDAGNGSSAWFH